MPWWHMYGREEGGVGWFPSFSRIFNEWGVDEVLSLLLVIHGKKILPSQEDFMFLKELVMGTSRLNFSIRF